jgi:hypothetical protein
MNNPKHPEIYCSEACAETDGFVTTYFRVFYVLNIYDKVNKRALTNVSTEPSVSAQVTWEYL